MDGAKKMECQLQEDVGQPAQGTLWSLYYFFCGDKEDVIIGSAILCLSVGFAIMCMGFIVPREFVFDPSLPARQMEAIEIHYSKLSYFLDVCIVIGMGFIAVGGLLVSTFSLYVYYYGRDKIYRQKDCHDMTLLHDGNTAVSSYGSNEK